MLLLLFMVTKFTLARFQTNIGCMMKKQTSVKNGKHFVVLLNGVSVTKTLTPMKGVYKMTFDELMNIRHYLVAASTRLITLEMKCGINTFDQWKRFSDSWDIVRAYMTAHPELP